MDAPDLSHLAQPGQQIDVKVTPKASRNRIRLADGEIRIYIITAPEGGKATKAAQALLAKAMGVAKTRLTLIKGTTSRYKSFRLD